LRLKLASTVRSASSAGHPARDWRRYTSQLLKQSFVGTAFFGDGGSNNGAFYEGLTWPPYQLPVIFVCENNLYAPRSL